jgi:AmmeMemoRadiSam system protein B
VIRKTAVAGSWYPDNPTRLAGELDLYLQDATVEQPPHPPRALISPHAGLMYSGPVAAFAYKLLNGRSYRAIVLVGPSHFLPFRGVSIWPAGQWQTPFGPVAVDEALAHAVRTECVDVLELPAAHGREHSLEMQLPFIAHLLPGVPIVPLVMGQQTRDAAFALGNGLAAACRVRDEESGGILLIASSDLSHYENAAVASAMDAIMVRHIEALDPEGLMNELEREPRHACGGGPMAAVLQAAKRLGAAEARVLRYGDSGDITGDKSSVVGYLAAAVF